MRILRAKPIGKPRRLAIHPIQPTIGRRESPHALSPSQPHPFCIGVEGEVTPFSCPAGEGERGDEGDKAGLTSPPKEKQVLSRLSALGKYVHSTETPFTR